MGGCNFPGDRLMAVAVGCKKKPCSVLGEPFFCFLPQMGIETLVLLCRDSILGILNSFQFGVVFSGRWVLTIECSLMGRCSQGHELTKNI